MTRILGIDPGLRHTGWGVVDQDGTRLRYVASGTIDPRSDLSLGERLLALAAGIEDVIGTHGPDAAALEETFVSQGPRSALLLGQARGVALMVLTASGFAVGEYAATVIKKAVVGTGRADKVQVESMIGHLLPGARGVTADAADALAVAVCHASHVGTEARMRLLA